MLPLQGANGLIVLFTQGVAIGLDYIGPSARSMCQCKRLKSGFFATKWQYIKRVVGYELRVVWNTNLDASNERIRSL